MLLKKQQVTEWTFPVCLVNQFAHRADIDNEREHLNITFVHQDSTAAFVSCMKMLLKQSFHNIFIL